MCSTRKIPPRSGVICALNKGAHFAKNEPLHSPKKKFQSKSRLRKAAWFYHNVDHIIPFLRYLNSPYLFKWCFGPVVPERIFNFCIFSASLLSPLEKSRYPSFEKKQPWISLTQMMPRGYGGKYEKVKGLQTSGRRTNRQSEKALLSFQLRWVRKV